MCSADPVCFIPIYSLLACLLIIIAPMLVWLAGEIGLTITDLVPLFFDWYKEQWRRARDAWRRW
jgi:hypothetical protein